MKTKTKYDTDLWLKQWQQMFSFVPAQIATVLEALRWSSRDELNSKRWDLLQQWLELGQRLWLHLEEHYSVCPNCDRQIPISQWLKVARGMKYCCCSYTHTLRYESKITNGVLAISVEKEDRPVIELAVQVVRDEQLGKEETILILRVFWDKILPETELNFGEADLSVLDEIAVDEV